MKIYFDNTMVNDFMSYAMQRKSEIEQNYKILPHFKSENVKPLAEYYGTNNRVYCTDKGEQFINGEQIGWTPRKIFFPNGVILESQTEIIAYEKKMARENRTSYIEDNIFNNIWCEIERLLRREKQGLLDKYDKRILNKARKQTVSEN